MAVDKKVYKIGKRVCGNCEFWHGNRDKHKAIDTLYSYVMGACDEMLVDEVELDIQSGWDGHSVNAINTNSTFGCNLFKKVVDKPTGI
jgi:hypothetical protein